MIMYYRKLITITLVVQPILLGDVRSLRCVRIPFGFAKSLHFMGKFNNLKSHYSNLPPQEIVSIADSIANCEIEPLPPVSNCRGKNLYLPGETFNIDSTTLKLYANELSQLLNGATFMGVTQVSQERLHAIFIHLRDKWRGASRLLIYHPNKFYPPIYLGSKIATLYNVTNISPTYLEDTLNVMKNMIITRISYTFSDIHGLEIELLDRTVGNSKYLMRFTPSSRRNNLTVTDITDDNSIELFNSDEWIFPDKKRQIDRERMLKTRKIESRKLYNSLNNSEINDLQDESSEVRPTKLESKPQDIFKGSFSNIPISRLMSQSIPGLSLGTAVDLCQSQEIPQEKLSRELTTVELQRLMDKVKEWQSVKESQLMPHISQIDDVYYYNVTNFRGIVPEPGMVYSSVTEMLYCYFESNTIPSRHREIAKNAARLCEEQREKLTRMASSLDPSDSPERLGLLYEKIDLLEKYSKSISECMYYTTMDSHQMLLELIEDIKELSNSQCTSSKDRIKLKGKALEFDRELHSFTSSSINKPSNIDKDTYGGLLSVKCLVDDPDSPILVIGRNAKQNDRIVSEIGRPSDLWFHASHVPGAHVLLKSKKELSNDVMGNVIQFAADVAAYFSKAKGGRKSYSALNVTPNIGDSSVDVTMAKFSDVVKEAGMDPGAVIVKIGKIIKASPKRARKKVEDVINQRIKNNQ